MKRSTRYVVYAISAIFFLCLAVYNYTIGSKWMYDNIATIGILVLAFILHRWLKMDLIDILLLDLALALHNFGCFDFYSFTWWVFEYDNLVHFVSSFAGAYIFFDFLVRKLSIKDEQRKPKTHAREHRAIMILLVISMVTAVGAFIEVTEFLGGEFLGSGDGVFFMGTGDGGAGGPYPDAMTDILTNTVGAIIGTFVYYTRIFKRKPWLRY